MFFINQFIQSQSISGIVYNENNVTLPGATVFLEGTTFYTITNEKGEFLLQVSKQIQTNLVIRFIGYENLYISNPFEKPKESYFLKPKTLLIPEIVVTNQVFTRQEKLDFFKSELFGNKAKFNSCTIKNEDDIDFQYNQITKTFKAFSKNPLKISNSYLQYDIDFELITFEVQLARNKLDNQFVEKIFFEGISAYIDLDINSKEIQKRRKEAYFNSKNFVFKTLIDNTWKQNKLKFFKFMYERNPLDYFKIEKLTENNLYKITLTESSQRKPSQNEPYFLTYNLLYKKHNQSKIIFYINEFFADSFGNISNVNEIEFGGHLGKYRLGHMLPMNYLPN